MSDLQTSVVNIKLGEEYDVYIGRPSVWGNPYSHLRGLGTRAKYLVESRDKAIELYTQWLVSPRGAAAMKALRFLEGKRLGCHCRPKEGFQSQLMCHGQILVAIIEGVDPKEVP